MEQPNTVLIEEGAHYVGRDYVAPPVIAGRSDSAVVSIDYTTVYTRTPTMHVTLVTMASPHETSELARRANTIIDGAVSTVESSTSG
jgi:hypothetical protein